MNDHASRRVAVVIGAGGGLGPALVMKHFLPLLPKSGRCVAGFVSAKAGLKVRPAEEAASACRVNSVLGSWPKQYVRKKLLNP